MHNDVLRNEVTKQGLEMCQAHYTLRFATYKNITARVTVAFKRPGLKIAVGTGIGIGIGITSNEKSLFRFVRQIDTGLQGTKMTLF